VSTPTTASLSSYGSRRSSAQSLQSCSTEVEGSGEAQTKSFSQSSAALRCAISKARQEAASRKVSLGRVPQGAATFLDGRLPLGPDDDPLIVEEAGGLLKNRIKRALLGGHLNVAAMQLKSIPAEIKQMYDVHEDPSINWSECVDLTKFNMADNKLEKLEDDIFPDVTNAELESAEVGEQNGQLRGLEALDLHNNLLNELPLGMRRLQKLRSLNISGNQLGEHALDIVCQIGESLTDLRMSENKLAGMLPNCIDNLSNLQVLDLHGNNISALPEGLQELVHLRILNLAQNRLSSISPEILVNSSLVELIVSGNRLSGVLFPPQIQSIGKSLKLLDVSHNALEAVALVEISLPNIQTLDLTGNRFKCLPDISSWQELLTIAVAGNLVCEMPPGLTTLRKLRNIDFSNNNIAKLPEGIASMENLNAINLAGNPLRERKYLTMSAQDLKADLQKCGLGAGGTHEVDAVPSISITSSNGTLDWSSRSLSDSKVETADLKGPIYNLRLHHNALRAIPVPLISHPAVSETLKLLDLAHNVFRTTYLSIHVTLPRLEDLSLASCQLKSLDNLTTNIAAPELTTLNISTNHLKGTLPQLRTHFPTLTALFVADNKFNDLKVAAVQGLITLDIRNNEIEHLEPRLGLLGGSAGLKSLEVSGNRFRVPRWDVVEKGTEAVLRYLKGRVPLDELGDEAAGMGQM
jgi:Leucine-rich repeat (LRR) protein